MFDLKRKFLIFVALSLLLAACGGGGAGAPAGSDSAHGKSLYEQAVIGPNSAPGCVTCHSLEPGATLVGPSHAGLGARAETAVPGQTAAEYLRESIVSPDAHITEGFPRGVMYPNYGQDLSQQDIDDLVAFLLTLR